MANILSNAEKQGGLYQSGGWHPDQMARRRYQKGSIRKRGKRNPVWELQWWTDFLRADGSIGRNRESTILGTVLEMTRRQALKAADELLRPLNLGKVTPLSTMTFLEFVERYFIPNALPTLKRSTQSRYRRTLRTHLIPAFGNSRLCDVTNLEIQRFVLGKMDSGLGWACCDHFRNLLSKVFGTAKRWNYFSGDNPATGVELPGKTAVREKHALSPEQISELLAILREPVRTMFLVGVMTGLRIGEILGLRWKDLDLASGQLRVEQACYRGLVGTPKTKGSKRTVPMPQTLRDALSRLQEQGTDRTEDQLVFATRTGKPFSDTNLLHRELKPAGAQVGAPWLNWHTLRRTHCTLFQQAGGSLRDAQAQLGHSKMSTTLEIYTIPNDANRRDTVEKLEQLVTNGDELRKTMQDLPMPTAQIQ
jgi:integrase